MQQKSPTALPRKPNPVAIVGIGCRFPGGIVGPESFWKALIDGIDAISDRPPDRYPVEAFYDPYPGTHGKLYCRSGGFLDEIETFDARFFGISPREAIGLDPQHRLLLEVAWEAIEDAGLVRGELEAVRVGVFVGLCYGDYGDLMSWELTDFDLYASVGSGRSMAAGRISQALRLDGPSVTVDTACSSSLMAVHLACRSLRTGECQLALAGGANLLLRPELGVGFAQARMLAADGRCKFGDADADGFVRSEGVGVLVLKPLERARADGDPIYAVVLGSATNSEGRYAGTPMRPSPEAQEAVLRRACQDAGVEPGEIDYLEAHGTGTQVGDRVEITAIARAMDQRRNRPCLLGSVKSNLGHTEAASGVAGMIKAALSLHHRRIPASLHITRSSPAIPWAEWPVALVRVNTPWPESDGVGLAGVSSFGISGTNVHAVITEPPPPVPRGQIEAISGETSLLLPISARSDTALSALAEAWCERLDVDSGAQVEPLRDLCYTAALRRTHHEHRLVVMGSSPREMIERLRLYLQDKTDPWVWSGRAPVTSHPGVVFVFPGQGAQWPGMARALCAAEPAFHNAIRACDTAMVEHLGWSVIKRLQEEQTTEGGLEAAGPEERVDVVQPLLFAVEVALAALWRAWGIRPAAVVGHSMGEIAAAHVAGALSLEDAAQVVCRRSALVARKSSGRGGMVYVELSARETKHAIARFGDSLILAASNGPQASVVAGGIDALEELLAALEAQGTFARRVPVDYASHSPQMDDLQEELVEILTNIQPMAGRVPYYSTVEAAPIEGATLGPAYWARNLRQPVRFAAAIDRLLDAGQRVFLEASPHPVLLDGIADSLRCRELKGFTIATLRRQEPAVQSVLAGIAALYATGVAVDWCQAHPAGGRTVRLPPYPWQRERHWRGAHAERSWGDRSGTARRRYTPGRGLFDRFLAASRPWGSCYWETELDTRSQPRLGDHQILESAVLPAASYLHAALRALGEARDEGPWQLQDVTFERPLFIPDREPVLFQLAMAEELPGEISFHFASRPAGAAHSRPEGGGGEWTRHAMGHGRRAEDRIPDTASLNSLRARCSKALEVAEHYRRLEARGLRHGLAFRSIERLWIGDREGLGRLNCGAEDSLPVDPVHPALLDGGFQVAAALVLTQKAVASGKGLYLPAVLDRLEVCAPLGPTAWAHALLYSADREDEGILCDIDLLTDKGDVAVRMRRLNLQRLVPDNSIDGEDLEALLHHLRWETVPRESRPGGSPAKSSSNRGGGWLIFADSGPFSRTLENQLEAQGVTCVTVRPAHVYARTAANYYQIRPGEPEDYRRLLEGLGIREQTVPRRIVHAWSLDSHRLDDAPNADLEGSSDRGCASVLGLVQALVGTSWEPPPSLFLLTRGAQVINDQPLQPEIFQAPLWGLARVIQLEHPEFDCRIIDLDPEAPKNEVGGLIEELRCPDDENQIGLRAAGRFAARLDYGIGRFVHQPPAGGDRHRPVDRVPNYHLETHQVGSLASLAVRECPLPDPAEGEVRIRVRAAGLNFKDVLTALGTYPGMPAAGPYGFGNECAGTVSAIGEGVKGLREGDAVMALVPSVRAFAAQVTTPVTHVVPIPEGLGFEEAATLPVCALTAIYALCRLARLKRGERILIHCATGGVGLAAVAVAQALSAQVFATAGSPEKRNYLRCLGVTAAMDSRSLAFADQTLELTEGRGVDVLLNQLTGEAMVRGLSTLAPHGRFLELAKKDIHENLALRLGPFRRGLSYFAIDLDHLVCHRPRKVQNLLAEACRLIAAGKLEPLPREVFALPKAEAAFRFMAEARHIGKIVLTIPGADLPTVLAARGPRRLVSADSTYLITGGLGGLGQEVARWLITEGAHQLALLGRSSPSEKVRDRVSRWKDRGIAVRTLECDVSKRSSLSRALAEIKDTLPPLAGVVHAAGVLADATLVKMDRHRLREVLAPKLQGAWNLHLLTRNCDLDFFVLFSSAAALLGSPGQGNYSAANSFLDALAHYRRRAGLPAVSINWGAWSEVGLAARGERSRQLARRGIGSITPGQGTRILAKLLSGSTPPQVGALRFDPKLWLKYSPGSTRLPLLRTVLATQRVGGQTALAISPFLAELTAMTDTAERLGALRNHLCQQLAQVLRTSPKMIEPDVPLSHFGLDSLMTVELRSRLRASLGFSLPAKLLWGQPTIDTLAAALLARLQPETDPGTH